MNVLQSSCCLRAQPRSCDPVRGVSSSSSAWSSSGSSNSSGAGGGGRAGRLGLVATGGVAGGATGGRACAAGWPFPRRASSSSTAC